MGRKIIQIVFLAALLAVTGIAGSMPAFSAELQSAVFTIPYGSPALWNRFLDEQGIIPMPDFTRAVILPHHLITAPELTKFYRGIADQFQPKIIILVGPNHYETGDSNIQTCNCAYETVKGRLEADSAITQKAAANGVARFNNDAFKNEHSIYAHATFIKNFFPEAKIVPFILKWKTPDAEIDALLDFINNLPDQKNILVIGSVDFSHYQQSSVADFHDRSSFAAIANFDLQKIKTIEVDSPATLRLIAERALTYRLNKVSLLNHTNSQKFFIKKLDETTSHLYISFSKGESEKISQLSIHYFGDVVINPKTEPLITAADGLPSLAGKEERFFQGNDYNILNSIGVPSDALLKILKNYGFNRIGNPAHPFNGTAAPGFPCETIKADSLKVALCKYTDDGDSIRLQKTLQIVTYAKQTHNHVFLEIQWAGNAVTTPAAPAVPSARQRELARKFIDNGADLIIGHSPTPINPVETYKNKRIFYSLGKLIPVPKNTDAIGLSVGVIATPENLTIYTLPFPASAENLYK